MSRPRKKDLHLPARVHYKHGAYYYVRHGRWSRIATDFPTAMREYALLEAQPKQSVGDWIDRVLSDAEGRVKRRTLDQYRKVALPLRKAFVEFSVDQVRPKHIAQFMDHFRATPNWANRCRSVLKMAFDAAVRAGVIDSNPVMSIPRFAEKKRDRYLTDAEYWAIWEAASRAGRAGPALCVIMDLAYHTGQRIGDVLSIRRDDVTEEGIYFQTEKVGKRILVRMTPQLRNAVDQALALQGETPKMYLLARRNGRLRSYTSVRDLFARYADIAGVEDAHLHDLRAKALTDAKAQGKDPQALGGHSTEQQTNTYLRGRETLVVEGPSFRQNP